MTISIQDDKDSDEGHKDHKGHEDNENKAGNDEGSRSLERIEPSLEPSRDAVSSEQSEGRSVRSGGGQRERNVDGDEAHDNHAPVPTPTVGSLLTTAFVSVCFSVAATVAYMHFFPPKTGLTIPPVMTADMMQISEAVAVMSKGNIHEAERLFRIGAETMARLREEGIVVIDAKNVLSAPPEAMLRPSDLIPNAPDTGEVLSSPKNVDLFEGSDPEKDIAELEAEQRAVTSKAAGSSAPSGLSGLSGLAGLIGGLVK